MKVCRDCEVSKSASEYYVKHKVYGTLDAVCKSCRRLIASQYRIDNPKPSKPRTTRITGFRLLPEDMRKCGDCEEVKEKELFYVDSNKASGTSTYCKECVTKRNDVRKSLRGDDMLAIRRKWAEDNRDRIRTQDKLYRESNRDKMRVTEERRRARKKLLPDTLTYEETNEILVYFNGKCALCEDGSEALDHFIPLNTDMGGTTKENIIPLCKSMNSSKGAKNPFEWAEAYLDTKAKERFEKLVSYLADLNGLTFDEYREFVFSCFETKNKTIILEEMEENGRNYASI